MKTKHIKSRTNCYPNTLIIMVTLIVFNLLVTKSFAQHTNWVSPKTADNVKNPMAGNSGVMADAKTLYITNCAPCHGAKGKGDGPAAQALSPKPADHSSALIQSETDGALYWKLSEGRNPMPGYKKIFTDQQRWELVSYIRTLAKTPKK